MGRRDTHDLQKEIEEAGVELNALQKKIKTIIEKRPAREALAQQAQSKIKPRPLPAPKSNL